MLQVRTGAASDILEWIFWLIKGKYDQIPSELDRCSLDSLANVRDCRRSGLSFEEMLMEPDLVSMKAPMSYCLSRSSQRISFTGVSPCPNSVISPFRSVSFK